MVIPKAKSKTAGAHITTKNEPWVLACQVDQCFFITNPPNPSHVVVRRGKRSIIGMDGAANKQDFDQYSDPKMEYDKDDEAPYTTRRSRTTLPNKGLPFKKKKSRDSGTKLFNREKEGQEDCETIAKIESRRTACVWTYYYVLANCPCIATLRKNNYKILKIKTSMSVM
jgi:hypothetical protein